MGPAHRWQRRYGVAMIATLLLMGALVFPRRLRPSELFVDAKDDAIIQQVKSATVIAQSRKVLAEHGHPSNVPAYPSSSRADTTGASVSTSRANRSPSGDLVQSAVPYSNMRRGDDIMDELHPYRPHRLR